MFTYATGRTWGTSSQRMTTLITYNRRPEPDGAKTRIQSSSLGTHDSRVCLESRIRLAWQQLHMVSLSVDISFTGIHTYVFTWADCTVKKQCHSDIASIKIDVKWKDHHETTGHITWFSYKTIKTFSRSTKKVQFL